MARTLQKLMTEYAALKKERDNLIQTEARKFTPDEWMDARTASDMRKEHENRWQKYYTDKYEPQLAELRASGHEVADGIKAEGDRRRPRLDSESPAALMRTEQAWRGNVLPLLDKGVPLSEALRNADVDAVLGAERFAPSYFAAKNHDTSAGVVGMEGALDKNGSMTLKTPRAEDHSSIPRHILNRLAEMDPSNADTLMMAARADDDLDAFNRYVVEHDRTGGNGGLDAALIQHYAEQGTPEARQRAQESAETASANYTAA